MLSVLALSVMVASGFVAWCGLQDKRNALSTRLVRLLGNAKMLMVLIVDAS